MRPSRKSDLCGAIFEGSRLLAADQPQDRLVPTSRARIFGQ